MTHIDRFKGIAQVSGMIIGVVGIVSAVFSGLYWNNSAAQTADIKEIRGVQTEQGLKVNTLEANYKNINDKLDKVINKLDNIK